MNALKQAWAWLDGKKCAIAAAYWGVVCPALIVLYPSGTPANVNKWVTLAGLVLTAAGLGHKAVKAVTPGE